MVEGIITNLTGEILTSPIIAEQVGFITKIVGAVGIAILIYVAWVVINGIYRISDRRRWKRIERKLDLLLKKFKIEYRKEKNKK